ncbi:pilus assembly PilX N-terminal domain-containing protein [Candidatus Parcubacteria bacterium]|nr:pilus assembly PilX N-terminal domain-containing protein [Candidatus Parcubacteria bacterium]
MKQFSNSQKGVALYVTLIVTSIVLAIALGISLILVGQLKMTREIGDSTKAFFAADAGMERVLDQSISEIETNNGYYSASFDGNPDYGYEVWVYSSPSCAICGTIPVDAACTGQYLCYRSKGFYKSINRAIEIVR